jgi:hypothetical protein
VLDNFPEPEYGFVLCRDDAKCTAGYVCNIDATPNGRRCFCDEATGQDACEQLGQCKKAPCTVCQECLTTMHQTVNLTNLPTNFSGFVTKCSDQLGAEPAVGASEEERTTMCSAIKTKYFSSTSKPRLLACG